MIKKENLKQKLEIFLETGKGFEVSFLKSGILDKLEEYYHNKYRSNIKIRNSLIGIYHELVSKKRKSFTPGTFIGQQGKINSQILTKYVLEIVLKWDFAETVHKISYNILYKNHLRSVKQCYSNLYELLTDIYPGKKFKPYYFKKYKNIWLDKNNNLNEDLIREAIYEFVNILIKKNSKYKLKNISKWMNYKLFQKKILPYNASLS